MDENTCPQCGDTAEHYNPNTGVLSAAPGEDTVPVCYRCSESDGPTFHPYYVTGE